MCVKLFTGNHRCNTTNDHKVKDPKQPRRNNPKFYLRKGLAYTSNVTYLILFICLSHTHFSLTASSLPKGTDEKLKHLSFETMKIEKS